MHREKKGREERKRKLIDIYLPMGYFCSRLVFLLVKKEEEKKENVEIYHYRCSQERSNRNDARLCV
jgi:uncharacterized protein YrzB (UPF0473 family)